MHITGRADRLAQLVAQAQHALVQILQALFVLDDAVTHHEGVVAGGLNFQIIVKRGDFLDFAFTLALDHGTDQFARLTCGTDDQALAILDQLALQNVRAAVKVLQVRI